MLLSAQAQEAGEQLYNVAEAKLGATAKGTGSNFNKDWLPQKCLGEGRGVGTIFDPFPGATIDIRLVIPLEIEALELQGLDYRGTRLPKGVDIFIEGEKVASGELSDKPGEFTRIPAKGFGQDIRIVVTSAHELITLKDGKKGPPWGGFGKIRVLSPTDLEKKMQPPAAYQVSNIPAAIEPTKEPAESIEVFVDVRQTEGHPNTFWDKEDIKQYRAMLEKSEELQQQFDGLKRSIDERMKQPHGVPQPRKDDKGEWVHLPETEAGKAHNQNALDIANAATIYAFSEDEKYGDFAKMMLLEYAKAFPNYAAGNRPGFNHDSGKLFDQRLSDATWLIQAARGYDLIYNLPSMTDEERQMIEDDLLRASAQFIAANRHVLRAPTNWSAICTTAVLITGYATDDNELVELAMYGPAGKDSKNPEGVMLHFSEKAISPDGMWSEGAMGYQGMAMQALVMDAEILRHHGIDMYSYRDAAFKSLFDSPLEFAYPDLTAPAIHDSGRADIVGHESYLWEYGYLRYKDPKYLAILNQSGRHLDAKFQQFPVSRLYTDIDAEAEAVEWESVNLFDVGYGILRNTTPRGTVSLLMDYGPNRSHGHPDKLNIDLYVFDNWLIPDPGIVWYEQPLYKNWYHTTLAHNTLAVDELEQMACDGNQLVYGFGDAIGIQRANTDQAYAGVSMDRAVFLTPNYMADIFGAFAELPRKMDLCWHVRGEYSSDLKTSSFEFDKPVNRGYSELTNVRAGETDQAYTMDFAVEGKRARFIASGGDDTQVILGDGILGLENPTTIIQRRNVNKTVYGNAVEFDYDNSDYIKSVVVDGSLDKGYGALTINHVNGVDYGFASYKPGMHDTGKLKTDALQAFVGADGTMFLGGGTRLESNGMVIQRSEPGLALIEHSENGAYVLSNGSPTAATILVKMDALKGRDAYMLDSHGKRAGKAEILAASDGLRVQLDAGGRVEFAEPKAESLYAYRQAMLKKIREEQEAAMAKAFNECVERTKQRVAASEKDDVPPGTKIVAQAEDMSAEGGGKVGISDNKRAIVGKAFSGWNNAGHWLEYEVDAPADGYYNLSIVYCSQYEGGERLVEINGENQEPFVMLTLPATGGWANGSDDWRLFTAMNPTNDKPLLYKLNKGKNTIKMTNTNGKGVNLDYIMVTSPDVEPERLPPTKSSS